MPDILAVHLTMRRARLVALKIALITTFGNQSLSFPNSASALVFPGIELLAGRFGGLQGRRRNNAVTSSLHIAIRWLSQVGTQARPQPGFPTSWPVLRKAGCETFNDIPFHLDAP
jgi:hypothetical protein